MADHERLSRVYVARCASEEQDSLCNILSTRELAVHRVPQHHVADDFVCGDMQFCRLLGEPNTIAAMAEIVSALLDALGLDRTDVLGWSVGGYVAQIVALNWPQRLRRLVIAGSGLGGPDGPPPHPRVAEIAAKQVPTREDLRFLFFTDSEADVAAAERHFTHIRLGEHAPVAAESGRRQREAIAAWWKGEGAARSRLTELSLPVLVTNGVTDVSYGSC